MIQVRRRAALALLLSLALCWLGFAAATARGQFQAGGETLVLCSGGGLVQITLDAEGRPEGGVHLCPDLAPGLLFAAAVPIAILAPIVPRRAEGVPIGAVILAGASAVGAIARGPPAPV